MKRAVLFSALGVLILCLAAGAVLGVMAYSRISGIMEGACFHVSYTVDREGERSDVLYGILEYFDALEGTLDGEMAGSALHFDVKPGASDDTLSDIYIESDQILFNVQSIYTTLQREFQEEHPVIGRAVPDWGLSPYVSVHQLLLLFGAETEEMPEEPSGEGGFDVRLVSVEGGVDGYIYVKLVPVDKSSRMRVTIGVDPLTIFKQDTYVHVIFSDSELGIRAEGFGTVEESDGITGAKPSLAVSDQDVLLVRQIFGRVIDWALNRDSV